MAGDVPGHVPKDRLSDDATLCGPVHLLSESTLTLLLVAWTPGRRRAQKALEAPFEGVPDHLRQPLWDWIDGGFRQYMGWHSERLQEIALDLRMSIGAGSYSDQLGAFLRACNEDLDFMLDLAEALLERYKWDDRRGQQLAELLRAANSAYKVKDSWDGLEMRVASGVKEAVQGAIDSAHGSAGDHLTAAWNGAYGRNHDPVKSYSESIKAVEAALARHVSPTNAKQTLGTMIRDVAAKPLKWQFVIADGSISGVDTVLHMMRVLWEGQTSRHGSASPTRAETVDEARAAVHLAATLVQFGASGAFSLV